MSRACIHHAGIYILVQKCTYSKKNRRGEAGLSPKPLVVEGVTLFEQDGKVGKVEEMPQVTGEPAISSAVIYALLRPIRPAIVACHPNNSFKVQWMRCFIRVLNSCSSESNDTLRSDSHG